MKKRDIIRIIISAIICAVALTVKCFGECFPTDVANAISFVSTILLLVILVGSCVELIIAPGVISFKKGLHNIKECDDPIFSEIDKYKKCWGENKYLYIRMIQIINLYYKMGGKVSELVENKELDRLYARSDFLKKQVTFFYSISEGLYSLIISVIATEVLAVIEIDNSSLMLVCVFGIDFLLVFLFVIRYGERGQAGSYLYRIYEYEQSLLSKMINELESSLLISSEDERVMEMKQAAIDALISTRKTTKSKIKQQELERDIKYIEAMDLCLGEYENYYVKDIYINGFKGCLVYDKEKGSSNNYFGELNLVNQDYSLFYKILDKYGLINYLPIN